ncbi:MAG: GNAT family N-acetyltransferase [Proteobacteria bacterium]|nr:GNAT family N-acetyltransferase [Pseudomonadota bacterium]MBU1709427.1 GNAT family N-acetyltransferase [Pseudomonadota bacterium]
MNTSNFPGQYTIEIIDPHRQPEWDAFVTAHPHGWVCHTAEWLMVVQHVWKNLKPHYIIVRDAAGSICAGIPLCITTSLSGRKRLICTPFSTLSDPLATSESALHHLFSELPRLLSQSNASSLKLNTFQATNSIPVGIFTRNDKHVHHAIDLQLSEDELMLSFNRSNVRNRISKCLKSPLSIRYASSVNDFKQFYDLYVVNRQRLGLPAIPWKFFEGIWRYLKDRDWVELLLVYNEEEMVGGLLNLKYQKRISAEVLAYKTEYTAMCPNHLLFWTTITAAKRAGKLEFDFGRTPLTETGLVKFKDHWTSKKTVLPTFIYPQSELSDLHKNKPTMEFMRSMLQRMPFPLYAGLSKLFYARPR